MVLISLVANIGWHLKQFDVKNAFLYGNLDEEMYWSFHQAMVQVVVQECANCVSLSMNLSNHPVLGLTWLLKQ